MLVPTNGNHKYILYLSSGAVEPDIYQLRRLFNDLEAIAQIPNSALDITINFHYCKFLNHTAVACLGGLARLIQSRDGRVVFDWETLPKAIHMNLAQNGFLFDFGCDHLPWEGNSVPYWGNCQHDPTIVGEYLRYKWLGKGWVNVSEGLRDAIAGQVSEIYLNAFEHSQSPIGVFSCGQYYSETGLLQLTVIDFGLGIPTTVRALPQNSELSTCEALQWAFTSGNSSKQGICSGMGLSLLEDFVATNHGNLSLYTHDGCVMVDDNGIRYENQHTNFSGTLVNIALRCDERYYCLASEVSLSEKPLF